MRTPRKPVISDAEREELEKLSRAADRRSSDRARIILALFEGHSRRDVAAIFRVDKATVTKISKEFAQKKSIGDWLANRYMGSKSLLTDEEKLEVKEYVKANIISDVRVVVEYMQEHFGKRYTPNGAARLLRRMGFVYKDLTPVPGKLNAEAQAAFVEEYEQLRDDLPDDEVIVFLDGCHPSHNVRPTKAWILKGEDKQIRTNTGRKRVNINGALDVKGMRAVTHCSERINAQSTIELLKKIEAEYPSKRTIHAFADNATYYKNADVKAYLARDECRIKLKHLPTYSPNLNLIERLWRYLHKHIIGITRRDKFADFEADIHAFFTNFAEHEEALRRAIGTDMHLIQLQP